MLRRLAQTLLRHAALLAGAAVVAAPLLLTGSWHRSHEEVRYLVLADLFGRALQENNVHQYAMKRYGTQVWGWEMPWWGRNVDDARKAGVFENSLTILDFGF